MRCLRQRNESVLWSTDLATTNKATALLQSTEGTSLGGQRLQNVNWIQNPADEEQIQGWQVTALPSNVNYLCILLVCYRRQTTLFVL